MMSRLLEQQQNQLGSNDWVHVRFPECGTYLRVKIPVKQISADHKCWCELRGNLGSGSHRRLHWLFPSTSIHLADDVSTYRFCDNLQKLELRMQCLHSIMQELLAKYSSADRLTVGPLTGP